MADDLASQEAAHGEKMIEVKIRFWTNNLADDPDSVLPKHAWSGGVVRVKRNRSHGIEPGRPRPFNSLLEIGAVVGKVLIEHGIVLHASQRMRRYVKPV
jgi:hypothetical protein